MTPRPASKSSFCAAVGPIAGVAFVLLAACDNKKTNDPPPIDTSQPSAIAEDGADSAATEIDAELLVSSLVSGGAVDGIGLASTDASASDLGTRAFGDGAKALFFPRGCLEAVQDTAARTVTYTFKTVPGAVSKGCSGPNGLLHIVGEVKATYRTEPRKLFLDITGTDLEINKARIDWHATAEITVREGDTAARDMIWKAQLSGETARGRTFSRTNEKNVSWRFGDRCYALSGVSTGDVRQRQLRIEVTDFRRCGASCPEAGGKIVVTDVTRDKRLELSFDGTSVATYTDPKGAVSRVQMFCSASGG